MSSSDNSAKPSFWDKLTGHSASHSSSSSSTLHSSSSSSYDSSYAGSSMSSSSVGSDVVKETTVKETTIEKPIISTATASTSKLNNNSNYTYCNDHLSNKALAATCTKCISTTGPMQVTSGSAVANISQPAQVHFVGEQSAAVLQAESAAMNVEVPAQTITTTLPAKRVVVEVPERQVQVQVPGRTIQLENAPEVQVTTRPVIKSVGESMVTASRSAVTSSDILDQDINSRSIQNA